MKNYIFNFLLPLLLRISAAAAAGAASHNITRILDKHPEFSTFNHYLSATHLADEINRRRTITVCVVDNAAMSDLLSRRFSLPTIKNIISLHVFADYFSAKKLHHIAKGSATTSSLFQATGEASGTSGYVDITNVKGGKVAFTPAGGDDDDDDDDDDRPVASFVKSVHDKLYDISVIQISRPLTTPEAEAPTASPTELNITSLMAKQGCKSFSYLITAQGVEETLTLSLDGGLTIFCPSDETLKSFMPKYRNLTADGKTSLVLYHAIQEYSSLDTLRSSNGQIRTLATESSPKRYDFSVENDGDDVKIETKVVTATIKGTLIDRDPLAVYKIDKVLLPRELFKVPPTEKSKSGGEGDDGDGDDAEEDSSNSGGRIGDFGGIVALSCSLIFGIILGVL